jgi:uncharacterized protein YgiM (DUF1202 family)
MRALTLSLLIGLACATPTLAAADIHEERVHPDFADGLAGGPDFWEVAGVTAGDTLNLRAGPSAHERVLGELGNGSILRNLGCKMADGQRWCRVARPEDTRSEGWVAGRYLRESSYQP